MIINPVTGAYLHRNGIFVDEVLHCLHCRDPPRISTLLLNKLFYMKGKGLMDKNMGAYVIEELENYADTKKKIALLRYELEHPVQISPDDMIDAMAFSRGDGVGKSSGSISNKTLYIAMNYQTETARQNSGVIDEISAKLLPLEREIDRLDYYLTFLSERQREVVRLCFFEKIPLQKVAEHLSMSVWGVRKHRDGAVEKLAEMYSFVSRDSE